MSEVASEQQNIYTSFKFLYLTNVTKAHKPPFMVRYIRNVVIATYRTRETIGLLNNGGHYLKTSTAVYYITGVRLPQCKYKDDFKGRGFGKQVKMFRRKALPPYS